MYVHMQRQGILLLHLCVAAAWHAGFAPCLRPHRYRLLSASAAEAPEDGPIDQTSLFASLRARQLELDRSLERRWRKAECKSTIPVALNSWVRRMAFDWPRAAIGTADGAVVLADLTTGEELARSARVHPARIEGPEAERDMSLLHGEYDGGGLTALAFRDDCVVSAGREGGCRMWRCQSDELTEVCVLREAGEFSSAIVSSVVLAGGADDGGTFCWAGCLDGCVRRWELPPAAAADGAAPPGSPLCIRTSSAVLDVAVDEGLNLLACALSDGSVALFALDTGALLSDEWRPLAFDGSKGFKGSRARSIAISPTAEGAHSLVVGGSDGAMFARRLAPQPSASAVFADAAREQQPLLPPHGGSVVALTPIGGGATAGLLASGAHDGSLRVWDLCGTLKNGDVGPEPLYGLSGYKVWLGSVCTDGRRLVSDGRDNCILVHDFEEQDEAEVEG